MNIKMLFIFDININFLLLFLTIELIISINTRRSFLITLLIQESLLRTVLHCEWQIEPVQRRI